MKQCFKDIIMILAILVDCYLKYTSTKFQSTKWVVLDKDMFVCSFKGLSSLKHYVSHIATVPAWDKL